MSLGLKVKIWKLTVASSLPCSPSPLVGNGFWKVNDQPFKVPVVAFALFVIVSVQVP